MHARFKLTRATVGAATCPPAKSQAIYRDTEQAGLCLRVTASGARSFIFESKLGRQTVRMTIGPGSMPIRTARDARGRPVTAGADTQAARLAELVRQGIDPRTEKAARIARQAAEREAERVARAKLQVSALDAWAVYCADRCEACGSRNHADHLLMADAGGVERKRSREKLTQPGPARCSRY